MRTVLFASAVSAFGLIEAVVQELLSSVPFSGGRRTRLAQQAQHFPYIRSAKAAGASEKGDLERSGTRVRHLAALTEAMARRPA